LTLPDLLHGFFILFVVFAITAISGLVAYAFIRLWVALRRRLRHG
jgi:hypothetical protein